jgi:hypothetical protein
LGGIIASELADRLPLQQVILISSLKNADELPNWMKVGRYIPLHRLIPGRLLIKLHIWRFSYLRKKRRSKNLELMIDMASKTEPRFVGWVAGQVVKWRKRTLPKHVTHIQGTRDFLFPSGKIREAKLIKGGTHVMILFRSNEIKDHIHQAIFGNK